MSENFEPCTLEEATHVEVDGLIYTFGDGNVEKIEGGLNVYMKHWDSFLSIYECVFSVLAIKPMKKKKPEPIEFEATFAKHDGKWHPLYSLDDGVSYQNCKKVRFKCVEILEEEK